VALAEAVPVEGSATPVLAVVTAAAVSVTKKVCEFDEPPPPPDKGGLTTRTSNVPDAHYDWLASGQQLIMSRGGRRRDAILIRNFE
jgi:hypothetical protein